MKEKYPNTYINLYICNVQQFVHLVDYFHTWGDADISHDPKLKITNGEFWNTKKLIIGISKIYIKLKKLYKMVFARKDYQQTKSRILLKKPVLKIKKKRNWIWNSREFWPQAC